MMLIDCPCCGPRNQDEFICGGQAYVQRPECPATASDSAWAQYQFVRKNPKGLHFERWLHVYGCSQWFHVARDTVSHEIHAIYGIEESPPKGLR